MAKLNYSSAAMKVILMTLTTSELVLIKLLSLTERDLFPELYALKKPTRETCMNTI